LRKLDKTRYRHIPGFCQATPMQLDALKFMQRVSRQIALATVWTNDYGHILDDQQIGPFAVAPGQIPDLSSSATTDVTGKSVCFHSYST
jgi:hypothetical protein